MKEITYIIWIENGMTTMAKVINTGENGTLTIANPCAVMNMEYGLTADLQMVPANDPAAKTIRFATKMAPYILPNAFKDERSGHFVINTNNVVYNILNEDNDIVKVYTGTLDSFKK